MDWHDSNVHNRKGGVDCVSKLNVANRQPSRLPSSCNSKGKSYTLEHCLDRWLATSSCHRLSTNVCLLGMWPRGVERLTTHELTDTPPHEYPLKGQNQHVDVNGLGAARWKAKITCICL